MMNRSSRLSRALIWLLTKTSSAAAANAAVGDIFEELAERREAGGQPRWPAAWLNWRIVESIVAAIAAAAPRLARSAAHAIRDAARALRRAPGPALFILTILAVGISAATVTFSVVDAVVLRPLPFDHSEELVLVRGLGVGNPTRLGPEEFWALHDRATGFESLAPVNNYGPVPASVDGVTEELQVMYSTAELFRVLRLEAFAGRLFTSDDEVHDPDVAVIGYGLWQRLFGGNSAALGRTVHLNKRSYRIVGVLPEHAYPRLVGPDVQMWIPDVPERQSDPKSQFRPIATLGRVRPGVELATLNAEIQALIAPLAAARPAHYANWRAEARSWHDLLVDGVRGWMLLALGSVVLVVIIACVNAANVMLTRSFDRARELAVRASLGASRRQLALTLLAESMMLSMAAGIAALIFATWGVNAAKNMLPAGIIRRDMIALDGRVFVASLAAALVTGVLFGLVPAWQASRVSILSLLKDAGATATSARRAWRSAFLVAEVACVAVLLVVSTLFIGSFVRVRTLDLGFDRSNLLAVLTLYGFDGTIGDVKSRLAQIPGVTGVAGVNLSSPPLVSSAYGGAYPTGKLRPVGANADVTPIEAQLHRVSPDYFAVIGTSFSRGSSWTDDLATAPAGARPIVIDGVTARALFGDADPIGRQIHIGGLQTSPPTSASEAFAIVGVVPFVFAHGPERPTRSSAYIPLNPNSRSQVSFFLRTTQPPSELVPIVNDALTPLLPAGQRPNVRVADDAFQLLTATRKFHATVMSLFALLAILIGAAGIYGVIASIVAQRTREIGVRVALGATQADIRRGVLAQAGRHLLLGLAIGLPSAWALSRGFGALFFQVRPTDLSIYAIVAVVLAAVGLIAAAVPARRASRVDPVVSLRAS